MCCIAWHQFLGFAEDWQSGTKGRLRQNRSSHSGPVSTNYWTLSSQVILEAVGAAKVLRSKAINKHRDAWGIALNEWEQTEENLSWLG